MTQSPAPGVQEREDAEGLAQRLRYEAEWLDKRQVNKAARVHLSALLTEAARAVVGSVPNPERETEPERFFAIRRIDGELMCGEYGWSVAEAADDWEPANVDNDWGEPTEYEIVEMTVRPIAKRLVPDPLDFHNKVRDECDYCGEPWPCDWVREHLPADATAPPVVSLPEEQAKP